MAECNSTMMWEILFDKPVSVESAHLWNCKYNISSKSHEQHEMDVRPGT